MARGVLDGYHVGSRSRTKGKTRLLRGKMIWFYKLSAEIADIVTRQITVFVTFHFQDHVHTSFELEQ